MVAVHATAGRGHRRPDLIEDEYLDEEVATLPQHSTFGSVWESQIGVAPVAAVGGSVDDQDGYDDEPEIPEYLLAERRQQGRGRGGRDQRPGNRGAPGGRNAPSAGYRTAVDRERYGRSGTGSPAPGGYGGGNCRWQSAGPPARPQPRRPGRPRAGTGSPASTGERRAARAVRPDRAPAASAEPWSEVPRGRPGDAARGARTQAAARHARRPCTAGIDPEPSAAGCTGSGHGRAARRARPRPRRPGASQRGRGCGRGSGQGRLPRPTAPTKAAAAKAAASATGTAAEAPAKAPAKARRHQAPDQGRRGRGTRGGPAAEAPAKAACQGHARPDQGRRGQGHQRRGAWHGSGCRAQGDAVAGRPSRPRPGRVRAEAADPTGCQWGTADPRSSTGAGGCPSRHRSRPGAARGPARRPSGRGQDHARDWTSRRGSCACAPDAEARPCRVVHRLPQGGARQPSGPAPVATGGRRRPDPDRPGPGAGHGPGAAAHGGARPRGHHRGGPSAQPRRPERAAQDARGTGRRSVHRAVCGRPGHHPAHRGQSLGSVPTWALSRRATSAALLVERGLGGSHPARRPWPRHPAVSRESRSPCRDPATRCSSATDLRVS